MRVRSFTVIVLVTLLCLWVLLYRLGDPNFYHVRNESRRAQIVREMIQRSEWLIPHLQEEPILTKPPFFYWAAALFSRASGVTERTVRMPSVIAGFGIMLLTMLLGRMLFSNRAAVLAAFVLLSTNFFIHQSRYAELDALLALFTTAAVYFFWKGYRSSSRAGVWYSLFYLMLGCGMMTKGPFALTFPLIPILGFLFIAKEHKILAQRRFLIPSVFFFMVVLPWPLAVMVQYPEFYKLVLWETVIRAATGYVHQEPFYYYFAQLPREFFPWIFLLPCAAGVALSSRCRPLRRELLFVLLWFLGNLVFLSLLKSKRDYYLFSVTPAAALLIGATWEPLWAWVQERIAHWMPIFRNLIVGGGMICLVASALAGNPIAVNFPAIHFPEAPSLLFFVGLVILLPWCCRVLLPRRALNQLVLGTVVLYMLGAHYVYFTLTVPILNAEDSGKTFYRTVALLVEPGAPVAFLKGYEIYTFSFYANRTVVTLKDAAELPDYMNAPEKRYLVVTGKTYKQMEPLSYRLVFSSPFAEHGSWRGYVLLCNQ